MLQQIKEATEFIQAKIKKKPAVAVILGTGLGNKFVEEIKKPVIINYNSIPHFPIATVAHHRGRLIVGEVKGKQVVAFQGRFHYYEGHSMQLLALPIRVVSMLGVEALLVSNAAGNVNPDWSKGELMMLEDHINLLPDNPLRGANSELFGPRFPDMSEPYSKALNKKLLQLAKKKKIKLNRGVYAAVQGPSLETPAEYRYLRMIGADAVGMSTVPEVIVANHMQLPCCAISVLTNDCHGKKLGSVALDDIVKVAGKSESKLVSLFTGLIEEL